MSCTRFAWGLVAWLATAWTASARGEEPGWSASVLASPAERQAIERVDIRLRAYRPFHVYGNTVRRMYYRGNPVPTMGDLLAASLALMNDRPPPPPLSF